MKDVAKCLDGFGGVISCGQHVKVVGRCADGCCEVFGRLDDEVVAGWCWQCGLVVQEFDCIGDSCCICGRYIALHTSVVIHGRADVPSIDAVGAPCAALRWFLVDDYLCAGWGKGSFIEIKGSFKGGICR